MIHLPDTNSSRRFEVGVFTDQELIQQAYRLRYRIFAEEMGAQLDSAQPGIDCDEVDEHCGHLMVIDKKTGKISAYTRLLDSTQASQFGRFYSDSEFEISRVLSLPGKFLEIGRTCVAPGFRGGMVLALLWAGIIDHCRRNQIAYLMGCASIPPGPDGFAIDALYHHINPTQLGPNFLKVTPKKEVPMSLRSKQEESSVPPLLQAYLRLGAWVCGQPCWDPDFNVMDVFILLDLKSLTGRYEKHFLNREPNQSHAQLANAC